MLKLNSELRAQAREALRGKWADGSCSCLDLFGNCQCIICYYLLEDMHCL